MHKWLLSYYIGFLNFRIRSQVGRQMVVNCERSHWKSSDYNCSVDPVRNPIPLVEHTHNRDLRGSFSGHWYTTTLGGQEYYSTWLLVPAQSLDSPLISLSIWKPSNRRWVLQKWIMFSTNRTDMCIPWIPDPWQYLGSCPQYFVSNPDPPK